MATSWLSGATERTLYDASDESLATVVQDDVIVSYAAKQLKHHDVTALQHYFKHTSNIEKLET